MMNDSVVRAPITGVVSKRHVQPGEKLAFDAPLMATAEEIGGEERIDAGLGHLGPDQPGAAYQRLLVAERHRQAFRRGQDPGLGGVAGRRLGERLDHLEIGDMARALPFGGIDHAVHLDLRERRRGQQGKHGQRQQGSFGTGQAHGRRRKAAARRWAHVTDAQRLA